MQTHDDQDGAAAPDGERHEDDAAQDRDPKVGITEAVSRLDELEQLPLAEHVERFEAVHTELTVALSDIDKV
ncbi:hypothetical protein H0B56_22175 [Haloechinothrix sp. YIM 98757]|uniref:Uncharacterized protein n=1 Tax=Haloechinothrix aidingensis TaxID=2752311 RepID=A0A838AG85_9PSEU|nr:hypothetical protein [Haloechinothrix aidingensis]MBA0128262.1 hypothetical protein [Haloechinothrix aidingensis]